MVRESLRARDCAIIRGAVPDGLSGIQERAVDVDLRHLGEGRVSRAGRLVGGVVARPVLDQRRRAGSALAAVRHGVRKIAGVGLVFRSIAMVFNGVALLLLRKHRTLGATLVQS